MGAQCPIGTGNFKGEWHVPTIDDTVVSCANTAEPIETPFGLWTRVGLCVTRGHIGATWRIRLNRPCGAVMPAALRQITVTTCCLLLCCICSHRIRQGSDRPARCAQAWLRVVHSVQRWNPRHWCSSGLYFLRRRHVLMITAPIRA